MSPFDNPHFDAIYPLLPSGLKGAINDLLSRSTRESTVRHTLDQLLRFSLDRSIAEHDLDSLEEWDSQRTKASIALSKLSGKSEKKVKRTLEDDSEGQKSKKIKLNSNETEAIDDEPIYTLMSLSSASPIRKKVNIALHQNTIRFVNSTTGTQEASVSSSSITRAFLVPTAGKAKPHWTVVMLADPNQIIFGVDAIPSSLVTVFRSEAPKTAPKGTEAKPILEQFLSHLPPHIPVSEPSTTIFRSASGEPFVDAYLRAKDGHLLFFEDGILFGEKKPCIWIGLNEIKSVRTLSATGRTFSIFITCLADTVLKDDEDAEGEGEETEFSLIDGKNQDAVAQWIRNNRDKFGVQKSGSSIADPKTSTDVGGSTGDEEIPEKKNDAQLSDEEDSDYESDSESDDGSTTSLSSEDEDGEGELEEDEASESGSEEKDLDPTKHPLLAPGAMPRMSKAAVDAVINMVEDDLMGTAHAGGAEMDELEDEEVDELE